MSIKAQQRIAKSVTAFAFAKAVPLSSTAVLGVKKEIMFTEALKERGWIEEQEAVRYTKNEWIIVFDTSSWMEIGTKQNSRLADIAVPKRKNYKNTLDEIERLCELNGKV